MKIAVIGSRDLRLSQYTVGLVLKEIRKFDCITALVSGGAGDYKKLIGADQIPVFLIKKGYIEAEMIEHLADWDHLGKPAGPIRNKLIERDADACIAIINKPLRLSSGTKDCFGLFVKSGKKTVLIEVC